jgi:hypothetical protein
MNCLTNRAAPQPQYSAAGGKYQGAWRPWDDAAGGVQKKTLTGRAGCVSGTDGCGPLPSMIAFTAEGESRRTHT